jgi:hypothetical protein
MDANMITTAIGSLGFPIVAACGLFWYNVKIVTKMTDTVNNNTNAIIKLAEKMDCKEV